MEKTRPKDVLVVDDDDAIRGLICVALDRAGITADHANEGNAALDLLRKTDYSVVLLDLRMPVLGGAAVIEELQSWRQPASRKPVILVMTAFADDAGTPALSAETVQAFIRKPFDPVELTALVEGCVRVRRADVATRFADEVPTPRLQIRQPQ